MLKENSSNFLAVVDCNKMEDVVSIGINGMKKFRIFFDHHLKCINIIGDDGCSQIPLHPSTNNFGNSNSNCSVGISEDDPAKMFEILKFLNHNGFLQLDSDKCSVFGM